MLRKIIYPLVLSLALAGCNRQPAAQTTKASPKVQALKFQRFDKALFIALEEDAVQSSPQLQPYGPMLEILYRSLFGEAASNTGELLEKMSNYYGEPTLHGLYRDALVQYDQVDDIEKSLRKGFSYIHNHFPEMQIPALYLHVSGLNQNVLVADSLLSLSIDKYLGSEYPLYRDFFYEPQRRRMDRTYAAPDCLSGWIQSEYPFTGNEQVLLDRMVYEGKITFLLAEAFPELSAATLMGYTEAEYAWCEKNEEALWKSLIEQKHLYTPDRRTTSRYFEDVRVAESPAPPRVGVWIGWQIIKHYVKKSNATPKTLMQTPNAQEILRISGYRP